MKSRGRREHHVYREKVPVFLVAWARLRLSERGAHMAGLGSAGLGWAGFQQDEAGARMAHRSNDHAVPGPDDASCKQSCTEATLLSSASNFRPTRPGPAAASGGREASKGRTEMWKGKGRAGAEQGQSGGRRARGGHRWSVRGRSCRSGARGQRDSRPRAATCRSAPRSG